MSVRLPALRVLQVGVLAATVLTTTACVKDLRPKRFAESATAATRGRAVLEEAARAHGLDAWREADQITVEMTDTWNSGLFRSMMTPLPKNTAEVRYTFEVGSGFTGKGVFEAPGKAPTTFGVAGTPAEASFWGEAEHRKRMRGLQARIYAPSIQYFTEFPFRILEAETVSYLDTVDWQGRPHDRVLATWGAKPSMKADQYVVYVDRETHFISLVHYTVRDAGPPMASAISFADVREVDGLYLPHTQVVGFKGKDRLRQVHRFDVSRITVTSGDGQVALP